MKKSTVTNLDIIEKLVRASQIEAARAALGKLLKNKLSRSELPNVSALLVRCGQPLRAIKLLHPLVHPKGKRQIAGTPHEKAEYAAALTFVGAKEEANGILVGISASECPLVLLYDAFSKFGEWDYESAIPNLRAYCSLPQLTLFERTRGRVNLVAALVHGKRDPKEARELLHDLREITSREGYHLLKGAVFELNAQNAFHSGKLSDALTSLENAEQILGTQYSREALFVNKWKAVIQLSEKASKNLGLRGLQRVRKQAVEMGHWETLRDCDRFQGIYCAKKTLLVHVYFGTPHKSFRTELLSQRVTPFSIPDSYSWILGNGNTPVTVDLRTTQINGKHATPALSQKLHKLFQILASDFYRPWGIPSLFNQLYPGEWFNPLSSPPRVHRLIQRLRSWFLDTKIYLEVSETEGGYRLSSIRPVTIYLEGESANENKHLTQLKRRFPGQKFGVSEAREILDISLRSAERLLGESTQHGRLVRVGRGKSTVYFFS